MAHPKSVKSFEEYIFRIVLSIGVGLSLYGAFNEIIVVGNSLNLYIALIAVAYFSIALFLVLKKDLFQWLIVPTIGVILFFNVLLWFTLDGINGAGYYLFTSSIIVILLSPRQYMWLIFWIIVIMAIPLLWLHYNRSPLFLGFGNSTEHVDFVILLAGALLVVFYFKTEYIKEKNSRNVFSQHLKELHQLILKKGDVKEQLQYHMETGLRLFNQDSAVLVKIVGEEVEIIDSISDNKNMRPGKRYPVRITLSHRIFETGKSYYYNASSVGKKHQFRQISIGSFIGAPIYKGNKLIGTISFLSEESGRYAFQSTDLELAELIAQNISHILVRNEQEADINKTLSLLEQSENRFRSIFQYASLGIVLSRLDGQIILCNPAVCELTGYTERELVSRRIQQLVKHPEGMGDRWQKLMDGRLDYYTVEHELFTKSGDTRTISAATSMIKGADPDEHLIVGLIEDISTSKQREQQIQKLNSKLAEQVGKLQLAYKEMESFSYSVSHDLRAPLRAIDSFAGFLQEEYNGKLDKEGQRYINVIANNGKKMGMLIDDLLEFSRLSRKDRIYEDFSMGVLVDEIIRENKADHNGHIVEVIYENLPVVKGDRSMLAQLLRNLLSNAFKFTANTPNPKIEIEWQKDEHYYTFIIRDNGVGFDMNYYDKIFGVFQRLHSDDEFEGSGVGLAIAQRIVERHNGRIWAESQPDSGAVFYFTLPLLHS